MIPISTRVELLKVGVDDSQRYRDTSSVLFTGSSYLMPLMLPVNISFVKKEI